MVFLCKFISIPLILPCSLFCAAFPKFLICPLTYCGPCSFWGISFAPSNPLAYSLPLSLISSHNSYFFFHFSFSFIVLFLLLFFYYSSSILLLFFYSSILLLFFFYSSFILLLFFYSSILLLFFFYCLFPADFGRWNPFY